MTAFTYEDARNLVASSSPHIVITSNYTSIEDNAFYNLGPIKTLTIPNSITSIGDWAFKSHELTSINIPNSVRQLEDKRF